TVACRGLNGNRKGRKGGRGCGGWVGAGKHKESKVETERQEGSRRAWLPRRCWPALSRMGGCSSRMPPTPHIHIGQPSARPPDQRHAAVNHRACRAHCPPRDLSVLPSFLCV